MNNNNPIVYVVHSIDTEGPLYESIEETFKRIEDIYGVDIEPSQQNLKALQQGSIDMGGLESQIQKLLSSDLINFNDDYGKIEEMLHRIGNINFRNKLLDCEEKGWVYNWHCVDHVGYDLNPRRKDIGYHNIFDYYQSFIKETKAPDGIHWHFHPIHWSRASHISATLYQGDPRFSEIIAKRILERNWFPSVNRAGFHTERPDSHWLLEQWIPFDLSNQSADQGDEQDDLTGGRFGDWRRAPMNWDVYNPSHDDYQVPGDCRRYIGRCLNVGTRLRLMDQYEVNKAFNEARTTGKALMGFTNHDFRDIGPDVDNVREMLQVAQTQYPDVNFKFCDAREAFNLYLWDEYKEPHENILTYDLSKGFNEKQVKLTIKANSPTFGPQPFLALKTKGGSIIHDNFDFQTPFYHWTYIFDYLTIKWDQLEAIGVGTNDKQGFPHIIHINTNNVSINSPA